MFQANVVQKIKTHIPCSISFFRKSCLLSDNVEKNVEAHRPQMTVWRMLIACWITKATNILSEYVILTAFPLQKDCTNEPQCCITRTLPVMLKEPRTFKSTLINTEFCRTTWILPTKFSFCKGHWSLTYFLTPWSRILLEKL